LAPKFNVVCKPNEWVKSVGGSQGGQSNLTALQQLQVEYWTEFREYLAEQGSFLKGQKPYPQNWTEFAIGRSYFSLAASINTRDNRISVILTLTGPDVVAHFKLLEQQKREIEDAIGAPLSWQFKVGRKQNYVTLDLPDTDPKARESWPRQHAWLKEMLERFYSALAPRVKALDAANLKSMPEFESQEVIRRDIGP
jgi:hypothetical protein